MKKKPVDPGSDTPTPPEIVEKAAREAHALLEAIWQRNLVPATEYIRHNPPSAEAIAWLGFHLLRVQEELTSQQNSRNAQRPRRNSLEHKIRKLGIKRYAEVREKAPELRDAYSKEQLTQAISKAKKK